MSVQLYAVESRPGEWIAYERHPVPGGKDLALVSRSSEEEALEAARAHLKGKGGSAFRAERSVVGA